MVGEDNGLMKQNRKILKTSPSLGLSICEKELVRVVQMLGPAG